MPSSESYRQKPGSDDTRSSLDSSLYDPFIRDDLYGDLVKPPLQRSLLQKLQLAVASITILPFRVVLLLWVIILFYLVCRLATIFLRPEEVDGNQKERALILNLRGLRRSLVVFFGRCCSRAALFILGFHRIVEVEVNHPPATSKAPELNGTVRESDQQRTVTIIRPSQTKRRATCINPRPPGGARWQQQQSREEGGRPACVVSNHVSWVDVLYHTWAHPRDLPSFAAKEGVLSLPLFGFMSRCLGCIYVRREGTGSGGSSAVLMERLRAAARDPTAPMPLLFPEGTTTNGRYLLPFKSGAFLTRDPVLPVLLSYPHPPGAVSPAWESISGKRHVFFMLCSLSHTLVVKRFPPYVPSPREREDPKLYAEQVRRLLAAEGGLQLSDATLHDKRAYHARLRSEEPPQPPLRKTE